MNHLIEVAHLQFGDSVHDHYGGTRWHTGRFGAGEVAGSPISCGQQEVFCSLGVV